MDPTFFAWVESLLEDLDDSSKPTDIQEAGGPSLPNGRSRIELKSYLLMYAVYLLEQIKANTDS